VLRYTLRRLLSTLPVLFGVTLLVFAMVVIAPGDRVIAMLGPSAQGISAEALEILRQTYGLDRPLPIQYVDYVAGLLRGDLGQSVRTQQSVAREIMARFPATLQLSLSALALAALLGITLGVLAAVRKNSPIDFLAMIVALAGVSIPVFWSGLILMNIFALNLGWLPASGYGGWQHLVLPAVTVGFASAAFIARITRSSVLEVLAHDYIQTARAKGLSPRTVYLKHALRNALLPVVTVVGLQFGNLLGGAVLTETVFAWPGIGRMLVDAIHARDLPLIQGTVLFIATLFIGVNLLVDLSYAWINPRIRYD
jgi:peptide/nickel transport system permease protein